MKTKILSSSGFGIVQVLLITAAFAGLMAFVVSTIGNMQKRTASLISSDELDALANEITLALRADPSICVQMIQPGYNPNRNTAITIRYPSGELLVDPTTSGPTFQMTQVVLSKKIRQVGGSSLSEIQLTANRKLPFGAPSTKPIPIYKAFPIYFGGGQCVATRYFDANSKTTFEDNLCHLVTDTSGNSVGSQFDYWPGGGKYCQ